MKQTWKRASCMLLSCAVGLSLAAPAAHAETTAVPESVKPLIDSVAVGRYDGDGGTAEHTSFLKISHPEKPGSTMEYDPKTEPELHSQEVFADGLLDYIPNYDTFPTYGQLGIPGVDAGANGQGDRGQTYSWASFAYGDWMYVSTLFNSTGMTGGLLGQATTDDLKIVYGEDMYIREEDLKSPGSTLCKINVKTGEVKIIMSSASNGLETSFRNAVEFDGKLYFTGSVNHLPTIFEIDPKTDAFQCVYIDPSLVEYPGGPGEAWKEARARGVCPTIRGMTVFRDHLVISTVGMDGNPYIAVSSDPSTGEFTTIARSWEDDAHTVPAELLGYPACHLEDSIMGGSIWEMAEFNGKLYVAIATGTPANSPDSFRKIDKEGSEKTVLRDMQSFALISGACNGPVDDPASWTWTPIVGDQERDGAKYTFGIDPERHRSGACNLVVFQDHLYIGEYNDTQIAFQNLINGEFDFLIRNLNESVSLYRLDADDNIEKVMGDATEMFPEPIAGSDDPRFVDRTESGFGRRESQYIWQSKVFQDKLYLGTFDETAILKPIGSMELGPQIGVDDDDLEEDLDDTVGDAEDQLNPSDPTDPSQPAEPTEPESPSEESTEPEAPSEEPTEPEAPSEESTEPEAPSEESTEPDEPTVESSEPEAPAVLSAREEELEELEVYRSILEADEFYRQRSQLSLFADFVESTADDPNVLLPSAVVEAEAMVEVDSPASLYLALRTMQDLMKDNAQRSTREQLAAKAAFFTQYDAVMAYVDETDDFLPAPLAEAVEPFAADYTRRTIRSFQDVIEYMEDAIFGFDMYVTENGVDFEQITRSGLGDPYNQGLRVFAANNSEENPWMCVGTANPFYGTQIWRMEDESLNTAPIDPEQVDVEVRLQTVSGEYIGRDWDKADRIYVEQGVTHVNPADISILIPDGREPVSAAAMPIETDPVTGTHFITLVLTGDPMPEPTEPADPSVPEVDENQEFILRFETNGGSPLEPVKAKAGTVVDLTGYKPVREGYRFAGWHIDPELTGRITSAHLVRDLTVYAKWTKKLEGNPFTDVPADAYYHEPVLWAVENGITSGMTPTTFGPEVGCTRAHAMSFLWRAAGSPAPASRVSPFTDVTEDDYFFDAVLWAVEQGITAGMTPTAFGPEDGCTRAQIVTFLWRLAGSPMPTSGVNPFRDVPDDEYYTSAVLWAMENGITSGTSAHSFGPEARCTRGQIMTFLYHYAGE